MHLALQAFSILSIAAGAGLVALLLAATRSLGGTHIMVDTGVSVPYLDVGLCWAVAVALMTFGVLALVLTSVGRRQRRNANVRQEVQTLVRDGKYGEARRAQDLGGFLNVVRMMEAIEQSERCAGPNTNGIESTPEGRVSRKPLKGE